MRIKLFEDWFDHLYNHPANQIDTEPKKSLKTEPFHYLYNNAFIILAEMDNHVYMVDIITLEDHDKYLYKELAEDYIGIYNFNGDIRCLGDIPGEYIICWLNEKYPNINIGNEIDDDDTFIIKLDKTSKDYLADQFKDNDELLNNLYTIYDKYNL